MIELSIFAFDSCAPSQRSSSTTAGHMELQPWPRGLSTPSKHGSFPDYKSLLLAVLVRCIHAVFIFTRWFVFQFLYASSHTLKAGH